MTKITDLTGAAPDSADVIPYVDVSDTTEDAAGTAKKATVAQLISGAGLTADNINSLIEGKWRFVSAILRSNAGTWELLDDSDHVPLGVDSVTQTGALISVNYSFSASRVIAAAVSPDEKYAGRFAFGASVGTASASIYCYRLFQGAAAQWICTKTASDPYFSVVNLGGGARPPSSVTWSGGELTINHAETVNGRPLFDPMGFEVNARQARNTASSTATYVKFYDLAGSAITDPANLPVGYRFIVQRQTETVGYEQFNPSASELQVALHNIWFWALVEVD